MIYKTLFLWLILLIAPGMAVADSPFPDNISTLRPALDSGTDQTDLNYVGSCMWRGMGDAAVRGNYAYLAMNGGLMIVDISNPDAPVMISKFHLELLWAWSIAVEGDFAYLVDYYGLAIIDISDPLAPSLAGQCETPAHSSYDIALAGDYAVVAQKGNGIQLIDISNPYFPALAGNHDTPGDARGVIVQANLAYIADHNGGLQIFDITDPEAPDSVGALSGFGFAQDIAIKGNFACLPCLSSGLCIVNIADPAHPMLINSLPTTGNGTSIKIRDTIACISDADVGTIVVNVADPVLPEEIESIDVFGKIADFDSLVLVIQYNDGFTLVNADDPQFPAVEGGLLTPGFGRGFVLVDGYAYGVAGSGYPPQGFSIVDISDPADPSLVGLIPDIGGTDLAVVDTFAYISNTDSVFRIVNIAHPEAPYLVDTVQSVGYCYNVASDGQYAYMTTWQDGLVIVNVSDPLAAYIEAKFPAWGRSGFLEMAGDFLYLEDFLILDISNRTNPVLVGEYQAYGNTVDVSVVDTFAYLASGDGELMTGWLRIINIADPANPFSVGTFSFSNEGQGVASDGSVACVTDGASLYVLDVSDPAAPSLLAVTGGPALSGVAMDGSYIYVSGGYGFFVYRMTTVCGDANDDGLVNVGDPVYMIQYIFLGGPAPSWICKADANGDGDINVGDAVMVINYIFRSGPPPAEDCCL